MGLRVGLVSDTHGLLRPEAAEAMRGVDLILHAGDVGRPAVLAALEAIAPVQAVRGNVDTWPGAAALPEARTVELGGARVHLLHAIGDLDPAVAARVDAVVCGHSHRPGVERRGDLLVVNPGSAGPRRFKLPVAVGYLDIGDDGRVRASVRELDVPPPRRR